MNIYFLVEGRNTEYKIYPKWLEYLVPELKRVKYHDQVGLNNYYMISGNGYPAILSDALDNAIDKITEVGRYSHLVLCLDVDEETPLERLEFVEKAIEDKNIAQTDIEVEIILQNRCIETWLLGNQKIFNSKQPLESPLSAYRDYYDVCQYDPEQMGAFDERNHADFHCKYLKAIFEAKGLSYTKNKPGEARKRYYLEQLQKRVENNPTHLKTFQTFLAFCQTLSEAIAQV